MSSGGLRAGHGDGLGLQVPVVIDPAMGVKPSFGERRLSRRSARGKVADAAGSSRRAKTDPLKAQDVGQSADRFER